MTLAYKKERSAVSICCFSPLHRLSQRKETKDTILTCTVELLIVDVLWASENWSRHLRTHREYGGAAQQSRRRGSSVGSSTTTGRTTPRVPYTDTTRHRARRRRRAFVVAPAARASTRPASELFAWGASLSTVRCRLQAEFWDTATFVRRVW